MSHCNSRVCSSVAAAVFLTAAAVAAPAYSADRLSLSERVQRLEQQASSGQGSVDQVNQSQALQSQIQALQGQVEELRHQLGEAQQRAKDQYIDLDSRIGRMEGNRVGGAASSTLSNSDQDPGLQDIQLGNPAAQPRNQDMTDSSTTSLTPEDGQLAPMDSPSVNASMDDGLSQPVDQSTSIDPDAEKRSYDEAFSALKDGRYSESARRFQAFIDQYPSADLTGNAYYWLGESYYVTQNYRVALDTFNTLLSRFPQNQKAPDALLKTGYCQYELKQWDAAEGTLNNVVATYPNTTVARLAQGRLRALQLENRR